MQRWLFFFSLLGLGLSLSAQTVTHTQLSYWFCPASPGCPEIQGRVDYQLKKLGRGLTIQLEAAPHLTIKWVRLLEGRLKDSLSFQHKSDRLTVQLPSSLSSAQIAIAFTINTTGLDSSQFQKTAEFLAFHPYKLQGQNLTAPAGYFFPAFSGKASPLAINLSFPAGQNSGTPGTLSFITKNADGSISHFWDSYASYTPEDFFLIVGRFEEFEPEDLSEEFDFVVIDTRGLKAERVAGRLEPLLSYLGKNRPNDSTLLLVDSLAARETGNYYLKSSDLSELHAEDYQLLRSYARHQMKLTEPQIEDTLLAFGAYRYGEKWLFELHALRWQQRDDLSADHKKRAFKARFKHYLAANPWLEKELLAVSQNFRDSLFKSLLPAYLEVDFRYVAADGKLYVNYRQDTNKAPAYPIPVKVLVATAEDSLVHYDFLPAVEGRLGIELAGSPYFVDLTAGQYFPGRYSQQKPDTYHLYALAKAQSREAKREALLALFKTANPNLFSTALGIAMTDEDAAIRLAAVEQAEKLNAAGRQKLKDSLTELSQSDPNSQVQNLARILVEKYYEGK